jgi:hypothetical protein
MIVHVVIIDYVMVQHDEAEPTEEALRHIRVRCIFRIRDELEQHALVVPDAYLVLQLLLALVALLLDFHRVLGFH